MTRKREVRFWAIKKWGGPTDSPKYISLKVLLADDTAEMLKRCAAALHMSKAEVMRRGGPVVGGEPNTGFHPHIFHEV